jgi:hypothetical protein
MEPEGLLPCLQELAIGLCHEPGEYHTPILCLGLEWSLHVFLLKLGL